MVSNLDKYKKDLDQLIQKGTDLHNALQFECYPEEFKEAFEKTKRTDFEEFVKKMPDFTQDYQLWYSEASIVVKQLLPHRLADFVKLYERPVNRKEIAISNYVIEDSLQGLRVVHYGEVKASKSTAIGLFNQQLNIVRSVEKRFESALFDIKQLVQADLFDSELDAAKELVKNKFIRAAGAVAGVVLEKHLHQVCENHHVSIGKKNPTINDYNELLKNSIVIDTPQWRFVQHLGDIRNLCDHNKTKEPSLEEVNDLILGVEKVSKTIY